jgi:hypothetical protein
MQLCPVLNSTRCLSFRGIAQRTPGFVEEEEK